jgi:hypothetical protein
MEARMTSQTARGEAPYRGEPRVWEAAVGRGEDCLKANARRYRVRARNPARAALSTLKRDNMSMVGAFDANLHIAVYPGDNPSGNPVAVFAMGGEVKSPQLVVKYARLQPDDTPLHQRGGPLDRAALHHELPTAARRRAEEQLGYQGFRELITSDYWERELTLYCGTAAVLAAIGFPMSPGVFVVGAIILLIRGTVRLLGQEVRIQLKRRRIIHDPSLQSVLGTSAVRRLFAHGLQVPPDMLGRRLATKVLRGAITVPDLKGSQALHLFVDEDSRIAAGGLRPAQLDKATPDANRDVTPEDIAHSDNVLTVVFRRPKRKRKQTDERGQSFGAAAAEPTGASGPDKVDLDDLGAQSKTPAKVDIDDLGGSRKGKAQQHPQHGDDEDVVDAEVIEEDEMYKR